MYQGSNVIFWAIDVLKVGNRQELLLPLATKTTVRIRIWRRNLEFSALKMQRKHQLVLISGQVFVTERSGRKNGGFEPSCLSGWFEETQTRELTQTSPFLSYLGIYQSFSLLHFLCLLHRVGRTPPVLVCAIETLPLCHFLKKNKNKFSQADEQLA